MISNKGDQDVENTEEKRRGSQGSRSGRKRPKHDKLVGKTFIKEILLLCLCGIVLPTGDIYSDVALIIQLCTDTTLSFRCLSDGREIPASWVNDTEEYWDCTDGSDERDIPEKRWKVEKGYFYGTHPKFATLLSLPVILSFVLLIPHWLKAEKTSERRWKTLPLLLLQVWPQYRVIKLLFKDRNDQQKYHAKKEQYDKNITTLEPYVEAIPTVLLLLAMKFRYSDLFFGNEKNFLGIPKTIMFWTSVSISVFSGSLGMAKFLKLGPCQIVPSQKIHCGFFFVFITMGTTLVAKGYVFAFSLNPTGDWRSLEYNINETVEAYDYNTHYTTTIFIWISSSVLPQFILAMVVFIKTCGFRNTIKLVWQYPAMILTPLFSFWTMGPKKTTSTKKNVLWILVLKRHED